MQPFKKIARNWRSSKLFHTATGSVIAWQTSHARHLVVLSYPDCPRIAPPVTKMRIRCGRKCGGGDICAGVVGRGVPPCRGYVRRERMWEIGMDCGAETSRNRVSHLKPTGGCGMIFVFPAKGAWFFDIPAVVSRRAGRHIGRAGTPGRPPGRAR